MVRYQRTVDVLSRQLALKSIDEFWGFATVGDQRVCVSEDDSAQTQIETSGIRACNDSELADIPFFTFRKCVVP